MVNLPGVSKHYKRSLFEIKDTGIQTEVSLSGDEADSSSCSCASVIRKYEAKPQRVRERPENFISEKLYMVERLVIVEEKSVQDHETGNIVLKNSAVWNVIENVMLCYGCKLIYYCGKQHR